MGQRTWNFQQTLVLVLAFKKNVLSIFLLCSSVCYQDDLSDSERNEIASSAACNFNSSWLLYVKFSGTINLCRNIWLIENKKMSAVFIFEIKGAKKDKIFNFFKCSFSVIHGPMNMIFNLFSEIYVMLLTSISLQFFSRYSKSYNNLNVKKSLKLNDP